jgi:biopolymer transport protein ExbB
MIEQIKNVLVHAGASWILWILFALSVLSVAVMIDRARAFWTQRSDTPKLVSDLHRILGRGDVVGAQSRLQKSKSVAATIALAGLAQWDSGTSGVEEAMAAATGLERARLERRLLFLGTVGNNAPFIGLLGTVIGVVGAFEELGKSSTVASAAAASQLAPERVMSTIAEALVATAVGLIVAIPAVAVFNYFQGLLTGVMNDADTLGHVLLAHVDADPFAPTRSSKKGLPENGLKPAVFAQSAET